MKDSNISAGVIIFAKSTGRFLLLHRNEGSPHPLTWSMVSGHLKEGEDMLTGLKREVTEEIGFDANLIDFAYNEQETPTFHSYIGMVADEFDCVLDNENINWGWYTKATMPSPMYPTLRDKILKL